MAKGHMLYRQCICLLTTSDPDKIASVFKMHLSFGFDSVLQDFLFKCYNITSVGGLVATCMGLASLAVFLEIIKVYRAFIYLKKIEHSDNVNILEYGIRNEGITSDTVNQRNKFKRLVAQTSWYTVQNIIGYIVMLAVMTFNGYFTTAVVVGSAFGYFMFGPWLMDIKLHAGTECSKEQKCGACIAKMEQSQLLSSSNGPNCDAGSSSGTSSSLVDVAEGLAIVMKTGAEEHVAAEVHLH